MEKRLRDAPSPPRVAFAIDTEAGKVVAPIDGKMIGAYAEWLLRHGAPVTPPPE